MIESFENALTLKVLRCLGTSFINEIKNSRLSRRINHLERNLEQLRRTKEVIHSNNFQFSTFLKVFIRQEFTLIMAPQLRNCNFLLCLLSFFALITTCLSYPAEPDVFQFLTRVCLDDDFLSLGRIHGFLTRKNLKIYSIYEFSHFLKMTFLLKIFKNHRLWNSSTNHEENCVIHPSYDFLSKNHLRVKIKNNKTLNSP